MGWERNTLKSPDDVADKGQPCAPEVAKEEVPFKAERSLDVEVKLGGEAEDLDRAWNSVIAARGGFSTKELESTYFDTSDLRLRRRGFILHVCRDGQRYVSLYIMGGSDGDEMPPGDVVRVEEYGHLGWSDGALRYSLVARLPGERLRALAEAFRRPA